MDVLASDGAIDRHVVDDGIWLGSYLVAALCKSGGA